MVDVDRVGSWYKTGAMATPRDSVADTSQKFDRNLTDSEVDKVTRYLSELTGPGFFVLHADLGPDAQAFAVDGHVNLTFSYPVMADAENLERISILDDTGSELSASA